MRCWFHQQGLVINYPGHMPNRWMKKGIQIPMEKRIFLATLIQCINTFLENMLVDSRPGTWKRVMMAPIGKAGSQTGDYHDPFILNQGLTSPITVHSTFSLHIPLCQTTILICTAAKILVLKKGNYSLLYILYKCIQTICLQRIYNDFNHNIHLYSWEVY